MSENKNSSENIENIENKEDIGSNETIGTAEADIKSNDVETVEIAENSEKTLKKNSENEQTPFKDSIFGTAVILGIITVITVFAISVVNAFASPVIGKRLGDEKDKSVKSFFGEDVYSEIVTDVELSPPTTEVIEVYDNLSKELVGYCVTVAPKGFANKIIMLVAVNPNITVRDTEILSMSETAGYGSKIGDEREQWFREQFISRTQNIKDTRKEPLPGENSIQIIAGATVSSKAFLQGVNSALDIVGKISGQKNQPDETEETGQPEEMPENGGEEGEY